MTAIPGPLPCISPVRSVALVRPANDNFAEALSLSGAALETAATNLFATLEPGEPEHADAPGGASIWWTWIAPITGDVTIDTQGSNVDTALAVYTGNTVGSLQLVAANDDVASNQPNSRVTFHAAENTHYAIAVDGYDGEPGNIRLEIAMALPAFRLSTPRATADGTHVVSLTGQPNQRYTLQASRDLRSWQTVATIQANASGAAEFSDPPQSATARFYRASFATTP